MSEREMAEGAKKKNILDMALTFTAMMRNFSPGSKKRIAQKLCEITLRLHEITSTEDYERLHKDFCGWFCQEIRTAQKTNRNTGTVIKPSRPPSFGQAAKVLDIALKVYVFYCAQPSPDVASRLHPFLHGAVDVPIMAHLKRKYSEVRIQATAIEHVDERTYQLLQALAARDTRDSFHNNVLLVQYDDIMWQKLNRETGAPD
jgi:hypothetical protein